jgi:hypothetical protein
MNIKSTPILFTLLVGAVLASCSRDVAVAPPEQKTQNRSTSQASPKKPSAAPITPENRKWVILSKRDYSNSPSYEDLQGIWQPSESDVPNAIHEARLYLEKLKKKKTASAKERKIIGEVLVAWDDYACQAIGHTRAGKKMICLSFFPKSETSGSIRHGEDWRHYFIAVQDGGAGYWRITYDCEAKTFLNFVTNDHAGEDEDDSSEVGGNSW